LNDEDKNNSFIFTPYLIFDCHVSAFFHKRAVEFSGAFLIEKTILKPTALFIYKLLYE